VTSATLTYLGRLPGVDADAALPAAPQPLRLDVAGFVGFAETGPLDTPVIVEDPTQYAAVFGGDLALAQEAGRPVWALLPTAVRAFFDNGGRRCYVVRVGEDLSTFPIDAFVDPALADATVFSLLPLADQLTSLAPSPVQLRGIHALLAIGEVALIAVPDAAHRGWSPTAETPDPVVPPEPPAPEPVDWSDFHCCDEPQPVPPPTPEPPPDPTPYGGLPALDPVAAYDEGALVELQVSLVTMCAARADQVALLSVPQHYHVPAVLAWRERLRTDPRIVDSSSSATPPLGYSGLWHPWVSVSSGTSDGVAELRDVPPDGVVAGAIAARELSRGVWVAPAGTPLRGLLRTVSSPTRDEQVALFDAHVNLVVHPPGTFSTLSAHTLTDEPTLLQLSVRRLLILLRKLAVQAGQRYVFEVDDDRFRQLVRMRFDQLLGVLLQRGALAAYEIVIDASRQDDGRLVVQLQVAPTSPVEFITVTLVRSGEGLLDVLEG
jgi:Bacteriophage tail sheath protein